MNCVLSIRDYCINLSWMVYFKPTLYGLLPRALFVSLWISQTVGMVGHGNFKIFPEIGGKVLGFLLKITNLKIIIVSSTYKNIGYQLSLGHVTRTCH